VNGHIGFLVYRTSIFALSLSYLFWKNFEDGDREVRAVENFHNYFLRLS